MRIVKKITEVQEGVGIDLKIDLEINLIKKRIIIVQEKKEEIELI